MMPWPRRKPGLLLRSLECKPPKLSILVDLLKTTQPRMCFPSLQQNASPLGLLSSYIGVLGKKIDLAETVKELLT